MATYESIKYKFSGTAVTGVLQEADNLSDVAAACTTRTKLGVAIGSDNVNLTIQKNSFSLEKNLLT